MNNVVIAQLTVVPLGTSSTSLSTYVSEIDKIIKKNKNVKSMLTPMGSVIEGELDEILNLAKEVHESPFNMGAQRVSTRITIDDRRDKKASMEQKINSVISKK